MKTALALLAITASAALGQGPLAPPAAPAPTMKTLAQIEARTPLGGNATDNGSTNCVRGFVARFIGGHGIYSPSSTITSANASGCGGAGIYCDNSSLSQCFAQNNGDDGIRAVASVLSDCRAFGNDTNPGPYVASGIYWAGGKIANSLADTAVPAIP